MYIKSYLKLGFQTEQLVVLEMAGLVVEEQKLVLEMAGLLVEEHQLAVRTVLV